ncbi:unnamed protein product [Lactuca saligna]|uniref:Uncharacterized protein n=1 Tax=Lactuca saligna TaxID=75948 RepID=A0AA36EPX8_LACSI|nr:unnamed protein product [Lactuca saligna]
MKNFDFGPSVQAKNFLDPIKRFLKTTGTKFTVLSYLNPNILDTTSDVVKPISILSLFSSYLLQFSVDLRYHHPLHSLSAAAATCRRSPDIPSSIKCHVLNQILTTTAPLIALLINLEPTSHNAIITN